MLVCPLNLRPGARRPAGGNNPLMRLPRTEVFRAFPELDRFSDEECRAWLRRAWRAQRWRLTLGSLGGAALALGLAAGMFVLGGMLVSRLGLTGSRAEGRTLAGAMLWAVLTVLPAGLTMFAIRDWSLRRAVRSQLSSTRCPGCDYQLLGLPVREGAVTCSECGQRITPAELGVSLEDLMPARSAT